MKDNSRLLVAAATEVDRGSEMTLIVADGYRSAWVRPFPRIGSGTLIILLRGAVLIDELPQDCIASRFTINIKVGREEMIVVETESPSEKGLSDRDCCDSRGLRDLIWSYHVDPVHPAAA